MAECFVAGLARLCGIDRGKHVLRELDFKNWILVAIGRFERSKWQSHAFIARKQASENQVNEWTTNGAAGFPVLHENYHSVTWLIERSEGDGPRVM